MKRAGLIMVAALLLAVASPWLKAQGFASLRGTARDLGLGEAGGAAVPAPGQGLINPAALHSVGTEIWVEAGDSSSVRQQRLGVAQAWQAWSAGLDLGMDSIEGLPLRSAQGDFMGAQNFWAPWVMGTASHAAWWGAWGVALGARDRRWLADAWAAELGLGWTSPGPWSFGAALWSRDLGLQGQLSTAWQSPAQTWGLESGYIMEGSESRVGLGGQWKLGTGLALRLGWARWTTLENQRWSLGLGWQGGAQTLSYASLPAPGPGSAQKLSVALALEAPIPTFTPTLSFSATVTPSPTFTMTPSATPTPSVVTPTPSPTRAAKVKEIELDFVLPK